MALRGNAKKIPVLSGLHRDLSRAASLVGMSRRSLLVTVGSAVAGRAFKPALAQSKVSQAEALYQDRPKNGISCAACALFRPPVARAVVMGVISPQGWCRFFDLPD